MPDLYSQITKVDPSVLDVLIKAMEVRAADPRQKQIRVAFLSGLKLPDFGRVLEVGCGTGAICRELAYLPKVREVVGLDPSPVFLARARELSKGLENLHFDEGDARSLPYNDGTFDAVIFHTCLTHVPGPEKALAEAMRVLLPNGTLAVFDGDYATTSVAIGDNDPVQECVDAAIASLVHDRWLARRLPSLVTSAGFHIERFDSHGYVQTSKPDYMFTLVDRGVDILSNSKRVRPTLADALKKEARRRVEENQFFGFIAFVSLIAIKPAA
ncbi:MAG: methyltransferase domain-containing protein [Rhizobiales bacterium]|nr:methyltransferase domain-containing protein [Hyphomicrobiales bacterium]